MRTYNIAVVGATGPAGQEFLKILTQRRFPVGELRLLASSRSVGKTVSYGPGELTIEEAGAQSFQSTDLVFFFAGAEVSSSLAPQAVRAGAFVIDNCAPYCLDENVPLVVPEVNPGDLKGHQGIVGSPSAITIQLVMALAPIHRVASIERAIVVTYQAVSGSGGKAMEELSAQCRLVLEGKTVVPHVYPHQIAFNCLPEADVFLDNGFTREEWRIVQETRRVLHHPQLAISATAVRVPVYVGHAAAVHLELSRRLPPEEARSLLGAARGVRVLDDPCVSLYPQPWVAAGQDNVFVGRIREDPAYEYGLAFWVAADNLRKGSALNALQIAELVLEQGWL